MGAPEPRIEVHCTLEVPELDPAGVRSTVLRALAHGGWRGDRVDVVLLDDAGLAELHGRFLDDPSPTDVMAFDLGGSDEEVELEGDDAGPGAELYVSVERAREVAAGRRVPVARELALYLVHGALHLCGHDDHEPRARALMRAAEAEVLADLGYEADEGPHEHEA